MQNSTPNKKNTAHRSYGITLLLLGALVLIPAFVLAQPGGTPPTGNVNAVFNTLKVQNSAGTTGLDVTATGNISDIDGAVTFGDNDGVISTITDNDGVYRYALYGSSSGTGTATGAGIGGVSSDGYGVYGNSVNGYGVAAWSTNGTALYARTTTNGNAAQFESNGANRIGVFAIASGSNSTGVSAQGTAYGVTGNAAGGVGVQGTSSTSTGVNGVSTNGYGVQASSNSNIGLRASSSTSFGGYFSSTSGDGLSASGNNYGVYSTATGAGGTGGSFTGPNIGVSAQATNPGSGNAGVFNGTYRGIVATGTESTGVGGTFMGGEYGVQGTATTAAGNAGYFINTPKASKAEIADESHGIYVEAPTTAGPLGQYGIYSQGKTGTAGYFTGTGATILQAYAPGAQTALTAQSVSGTAINAIGQVNVSGSLNASSQVSANQMWTSDWMSVGNGLYVSGSGGLNVYGGNGNIYNNGWIGGTLQVNSQITAGTMGRYYHSGWGSVSTIPGSGTGYSVQSCPGGDIAVSCLHWSAYGRLYPYQKYVGWGSNNGTCTVYWGNTTGTATNAQTAAVCFSPDG